MKKAALRRSSRKSASKATRRKFSAPFVHPGRSRAQRGTSKPPSPPQVVDPRLREGIDRFNAHQFFECHEVLEKLWLETSDRSPARQRTREVGGKRFYQGLIQASVAFHHWSKGNRAGALTLARSASGYLSRYTPTYLGVDVESFLKRFQDVFGWLKRHPLRYDQRLVPILRMLG